MKTQTAADLARFLDRHRDSGDLPESLVALHEAICDAQSQRTAELARLRAESERLLWNSRDAMAVAAFAAKQAVAEIHVTSTALSPSQLKRVRAAGGHYNACLGYSLTRFVHVPLADANVTLIDEIVAAHATSANRGAVVILRLVDRTGMHCHTKQGRAEKWVASAKENASRYLAARSVEVAEQADSLETSNLSLVETIQTPRSTSPA